MCPVHLSTSISITFTITLNIRLCHDIAIVWSIKFSSFPWKTTLGNSLSIFCQLLFVLIRSARSRRHISNVNWTRFSVRTHNRRKQHTHEQYWYSSDTDACRNNRLCVFVFVCFLSVCLADLFIIYEMKHVFMPSRPSQAFNKTNIFLKYVFRLWAAVSYWLRFQASITCTQSIFHQC